MNTEKKPPADSIAIAEVQVPLHEGASARAWFVLPHISAVEAQYDPTGALHQVRVLFPSGWQGYGLNQGAAEILMAWEDYVAAQQESKSEPHQAAKQESSKVAHEPSKHETKGKAH